MSALISTLRASTWMPLASAMPIDTPQRQEKPWKSIGWRISSMIRVESCAISLSPTSRARMTNSSPPMRATISLPRTFLASTFEACTSIASPAAWPSVSLMSLKRSRSMCRIENFCRCCLPSWVRFSSAMSSLRRLASAVSGSCSELCSILFLTSSSSIFLATASSLAAFSRIVISMSSVASKAMPMIFISPVPVWWTLPTERT